MKTRRLHLLWGGDAEQTQQVAQDDARAVDEREAGERRVRLDGLIARGRTWQFS